MGIKERKQRDKAQFYNLVITKALKLIEDKGLNNFSMRVLAHEVEYSQSKIYEVFKDKDQLCETLCHELATILLQELRNIKTDGKKSADYLEKLFLCALQFHKKRPHSDALFTLVCYGGPQFQLPAPFVEIEALFIKALKKLESPFLNNDEQITSALNAIRFLFIGASQLSHFGTSQAQEIAKDALAALIRGWVT